MINAVFFDFDGVLVNSMPFHIQAWQSVFKEVDIAVDANKILLAEGAHSIEVAREIFAANDVRMSQAELQAFVDGKQTLYQNMTEAKFDASAEALLTKLKTIGILTGLVTGTSRSNVEHTIPAKALSLFDAIVTAEDVASGKPNPESYLLASQMLNLVPSYCLAIENAPLGIQAARLAGMSVWAVTTTLAAYHLSGADRIFSSLGDIPKAFSLMHRHKDAEN